MFVLYICILFGDLWDNGTANTDNGWVNKRKWTVLEIFYNFIYEETVKSIITVSKKHAPPN